MKTKLLVATGLTLLLGTSLYAYNHQGVKKYGFSCGMQGNNHMMMKKSYNKRAYGPMAIFKKLNLTTEQRNQIIQIRKDLMKNRVTCDVAFTKNSFDKAKFIEMMEQKRDNRIKLRAEMLDKAYNILTSKQKEQFKVLIDLQKERRINMMGRGMNFDQNCYGRR